MTVDADAVVVGAGVVGLAAAAALARDGRSVLVLERNEAIARETTSRNSEVVHAGIYYPPESLKARLCVEGRRALYQRCAERGVGHRRTGKLVVATDERELSDLERIRANAERCGVTLTPLDAPEVSRLEPGVRCVGALLSPETGIVDAHAFALSFLAEAESHGASLVLRAETLGFERRADAWIVEARSDQPVTVSCRAVVDAAGLEASRLAALAGLDPVRCGYRVHYCKGDYFSWAPSASIPLSHLVYPVPAGPGLGIHATVDLGGRVRFGPDAEYVDAPRYDVDPAKAEGFADAVRRYLPAVSASDLAPEYAGVRPKLAGSGEPFADFVVEEESRRGAPGFVSCIGIESPGLTAAPAIADRVVALLAEAQVF